MPGNKGLDNPLAQDLNHVLAHTEGLWDELRGERLFITGGTGFFGCWLLESFAWAVDRLGLDASAVVLTRAPDAFRRKAPHLADHPAIQLHVGDIRSFPYPTGQFSCILHAATETSAQLNVENPLLVFDTIIEGTRWALEFARNCGARRFLLTSSGAVYGRQPPEMTHMPEDCPGAPDPTDPLSAYGEGKRAAEMLCALYATQYGLETKIARCFAFVGPYLPLNTHFAVGNFIRDALAGGPICVKGDGRPYRSYLYAADLAVWLWTILLRGAPGRPYNVGSEETISIADLAELVAEKFDPKPNANMAASASGAALPSRYVPCTKRAMVELQLQQTVDVSDAITKTMVWLARSRSVAS